MITMMMVMMLMVVAVLMEHSIESNSCCHFCKNTVSIATAWEHRFL